MTDITKSEKYYLTNDFFKVMQDNWYNFVVNYYNTYMQVTESSYDFLCKLFCDSSSLSYLIQPENMLNNCKNKEAKGDDKTNSSDGFLHFDKSV